MLSKHSGTAEHPQTGQRILPKGPGVSLKPLGQVFSLALPFREREVLPATHSLVNQGLRTPGTLRAPLGSQAAHVRLGDMMSHQEQGVLGSADRIGVNAASSLPIKGRSLLLWVGT